MRTVQIKVACEHCGHAISAKQVAEIIAAAGRVNAGKREVRAGGRPRGDAPRCKCGEMTERLAAIRGHKCNGLGEG